MNITSTAATQSQKLNQIQSLRQFLDNVPEGAAALRVCSKGVTPEVLFLVTAERLKQEAKNTEVAGHIVGQSYDFADVAGCETAFVAIWQNEHDQVLTTHPWRAVPAIESAQQFNGTTESVVKELQTHLHAVMRVHLEGLSVSKELFATALSLSQKRIEMLEEKLTLNEKVVDAARASEGQNLEIAMEADRFTKLLDMGERLVKALAAPDPKAAGQQQPAQLPSGASTTQPAATASSAPAAPPAAPSLEQRLEQLTLLIESVVRVVTPAQAAAADAASVPAELVQSAPTAAVEASAGASP